jgi:thymidylate synthase (FAD)
VELQVLDTGFVRLVDMLGNDYTAVKSARVSYGKGLKGKEQDKKLIYFLLAHGHETPFEHIVFTFHVKAPIFVARQWFRHRIGSFNEISQRYTEVQDDFYVPEIIRANTKEDKQKSINLENPQLAKNAQSLIEMAIKDAFNVYYALLEAGVAREQARIVLPLATYTQFYWTVNARSLMNFLNLRADSHAQFEMQMYAIAIGQIFKEKLPITYDAFLTHAYKGDLLR